MVVPVHHSVSSLNSHNSVFDYALKSCEALKPQQRLYQDAGNYRVQAPAESSQAIFTSTSPAILQTPRKGS
jgi:hypothetical protein